MKEYATRRRRLMQVMDRNSIAIVPAAPVAIRNRDVDYPYRPDSDFFYLSGFSEPEAVIVLIPKREQGEYILFCREHDLAMASWVGPRAGLDGALEQFGADDSFPIEDIDEILPGLLEGRDVVYYTMGRYNEFDMKVMDWVKQVRKKARAGIHTPYDFVSLEHDLHEMRLFKSRAEIAKMRKAAKISARAHKRAMIKTRPGMMEYQVEAEIIHEFMHHGCRATAYPPIVGGGTNACILHYTDNKDVLEDGSLLLIDAGAEYQYYAADITRTFPVNGRFTEPQRILYEIVLAAQEAAIDKVRPGNHWNEPHEAAVRTMTKLLVKHGILKGKVRDLIRDEAYKPFYVHRTGHWLGMDVHDVGEYKIGNVWRLLEPGMVLTVEPGIYIQPKTRGVARKWWGIGIRIEDDVLVTKDGCDVLSRDVPKTVAEIEALMAKGVDG